GRQWYDTAESRIVGIIVLVPAMISSYEFHLSAGGRIVADKFRESFAGAVIKPGFHPTDMACVVMVLQVGTFKIPQILAIGIPWSWNEVGIHRQPADILIEDMEGHPVSPSPHSLQYGVSPAQVAG